MIAFVKQGLNDLSISRTTIKWGIPLPVEGNHVFYVWFDALIGLHERRRTGEDLWPADLHLIGKEIVRFHAIYWPAFLMAAGLPLPKRIFAHGWLLFENDKMSKSRGNIVRAEPIRQVMGADALRYFLLREIVFGQDGSFSYDALVGRYNSDLANGLGNLASRTLTMIHQYRDGVDPARGGDAGRSPPLAARDHRRRPATPSSASNSPRASKPSGGCISAVDKFIVRAGALEAGARPTTPRSAQLDADALHRRRGAAHRHRAARPRCCPNPPPRSGRQLGMPDAARRRALRRRSNWGQPARRPEDRRSRRPCSRASKLKQAVDKMRELEERGHRRAGRADGQDRARRRSGSRAAAADNTSPSTISPRSSCASARCSRPSP